MKQKKEQQNVVKILVLSAAVFICVALGIIFWPKILALFGHLSNEKKPAEIIDPEIAVMSVKADQRPVEDILEVVGSFEALTEVSLATEVNGRVTHIPVNFGDRVSLGQEVVTLDTTDTKLTLDLDKANLQQELARLGLCSPEQKLKSPMDVPEVKKAKAELDYAYSNYKRNIRMRKEDLISKKDVEDALKSYLTSKANYESALEQVAQTQASIDARVANVNIDKNKLHKAVLYSPLNGFIKEKKVEFGDYMTAGQVALVLVQNDPIYMCANIPQNYMGKIHIGKKLVLKTDAVSGRTFIGVVDQISPAVDPDTRTVKIRAKIENPQYILKPGMFSKVSLIVGVDNESIVVPKEALLSQMGITKVFVIETKGGKQVVSERKIEKGIDLGNEMQIKGNIKKGDVLASSGLTMLYEGVKVKIVTKNSDRDGMSSDGGGAGSAKVK